MKSQCFLFFLSFAILLYQVNSQPFQCYGYMSTDTEVVCSKHGNCTSNNTCECDLGWVGEECSFRGCNGVIDDNPSVCSGNGTCYRGVCQCNDGFIGDNCDSFQCQGFNPDEDGVCNNVGTCISGNLCLCSDNAYYGNNCEYFECNDNLCMSVLEQDRMVSLYFKTQYGNPTNITFDYTLYKVYPMQRKNEELDCSLVFNEESLITLGRDPICQWITTNSHYFIVTLGEGHLVTDSTVLSVNLFPLEKKSYYVDIAPYSSTTTAFQEFWIDLMDKLPSWAKAPVYQVVGFLSQYWYWLLIGGFIFCIITFGSSFVSMFACCDPRKRTVKKNRKKVAKIKEKMRRLRERNLEREAGPRHVARHGRTRSNDFYIMDGNDPELDWDRSVMPRKQARTTDDLDDSDLVGLGRGFENRPRRKSKKERRKSKMIEKNRRNSRRGEVELNDFEDIDDLQRAIMETKKAEQKRLEDEQLEKAIEASRQENYKHKDKKRWDRYAPEQNVSINPKEINSLSDEQIRQQQLIQNSIFSQQLEKEKNENNTGYVDEVPKEEVILKKVTKKEDEPVENELENIIDMTIDDIDDLFDL